MTLSTDLENRARTLSAQFGAAIRKCRTAAGMTQEELALATGVGRRFLIDLEAGKPSCRLGLSLLVAEALGLSLIDLLGNAPAHVPPADDLPPPSS